MLSCGGRYGCFEVLRCCSHMYKVAGRLLTARLAVAILRAVFRALESGGFDLLSPEIERRVLVQQASDREARNR